MNLRVCGWEWRRISPLFKNTDSWVKAITLLDKKLTKRSSAFLFWLCARKIWKRLSINEKANCDINKFNPLFRIACRIHNLLCRGSAWIMENLIQMYIEEYWPHMHGYRQVAPVDVILLAPLQGCVCAW